MTNYVRLFLWNVENGLKQLCDEHYDLSYKVTIKLENTILDKRKIKGFININSQATSCK